MYPAARLLGGRGIFVKKIVKNLHPDPWRTGRPTAGRPAPRPPGGRAAGTLTLSCINLALTHAPHAAAYSAAAGAEHVRARRSRLPAIKQTAVRVGTYVGRAEAGGAGVRSSGSGSGSQRARVQRVIACKPAGSAASQNANSDVWFLLYGVQARV